MGRSIVAILFALLPAVCGAQERNFRLSSELAAVEGWILGVTVPSLEVTLSNEVAGEVEQRQQGDDERRLGGGPPHPLHIEPLRKLHQRLDGSHLGQKHLRGRPQWTQIPTL